MKKIKLSNGFFALVDDEDHDRVMKIKPWHRSTIGYAAHSVDSNTKLYMHRMIMGVTDQHIDHVDGDKLNNQKSNLRACSDNQNRLNRPSYKTKNRTSRYKGVSSRPNGKYAAQIQFNKKKMHIGYFKTQTQAAKAYDAKARELFGEFAKLNFG